MKNALIIFLYIKQYTKLRNVIDENMFWYKCSHLQIGITKKNKS